jgi:hypothetical protein
MLPLPLSLLVSQMRKENEMREKVGNIVSRSSACLSIIACLLMLVAHLVGKHLSQMSQMSQTRSILKMKIALSLLQLREIVICFSTVEAPYVKE